MWCKHLHCIQLKSNHSKHTQQAWAGFCEQAESWSHTWRHFLLIFWLMLMFSFPLSGSSCVAGSCGQLSGHGPPEQEHARVRKANTAGVAGECFSFGDDRGGWIEEKDRAWGLIVPKWFSIHVRKMLSNVPIVSLSRVDPFSHSERSHLLTTAPIDVECHHTGCLGSVLSLELSIIMINTGWKLYEEAAGQVRQPSWDTFWQHMSCKAGNFSQ